MRYVVEDAGDEPRIHEVVNMINDRGQETEDKNRAVSIVIRDSLGDGFFSLAVPYPGVIHTIH